MNDETTTPEAPELAPCPVCGEPVELTTVMTFDDELLGFQAMCSECSFGFGDEHDTADEAAAAWNSLALDVALGRMAAKTIARAREMCEAFTLRPRCESEATKQSGAYFALVEALAEFDALTTEAGS